MILYHGSNMRVEEPKIIEQNRFLDFGFGFYTTSNQQQAENFAQKVFVRRGGTPTVNCYQLDESSLGSFRVKHFSSPNAEWLDFITANRSGNYSGTQYDIIIGAVANDDVYKTLQVYGTGLLSKEQALEMLKIKKLFDQYVFTTERAVKILRFIKAEEVKNG